MRIVLEITRGLHMAAALFWLLTGAIAGFGNNPAASARLFRPQMIAATLTVFAGGGLWTLLHSGGFHVAETVLAAGALLAVAAAGVQGAMVGGHARRLPGAEAEAKVVLGQKIGSVLLLLALACMLAASHV